MPSAPDHPSRPTNSSAAPGGAAAPVIDLRGGGRAHLRSVPDPTVPAAPSPSPSPSPTALQFSESVRRVVGVARRHGLRVPVFRSPPRLAGVDRSILRRPGGQVVVAVRRTGRPLSAVRADIIDGVVAANGLCGAPADRFRRDAWAGLEPAEPSPRRQVAHPRPPRARASSRPASPPARVA